MPVRSNATAVISEFDVISSIEWIFSYIAWTFYLTCLHITTNSVYDPQSSLFIHLR